MLLKQFQMIRRVQTGQRDHGCLYGNEYLHHAWQHSWSFAGITDIMTVQLEQEDRRGSRSSAQLWSVAQPVAEGFSNGRADLRTYYDMARSERFQTMSNLRPATGMIPSPNARATLTKRFLGRRSRTFFLSSARCSQTETMSKEASQAIMRPTPKTSRGS